MAQVEYRRGQGVFARAPIKAGEIICFWEGYIKTKGTETPQEQQIGLDMTKEELLVGYIVPKSEMGIGQMIRDVTGPPFEVKAGVDIGQNVHRLIGELCAYLERRSQANAVRGSLDIADKTRVPILAARDITVGEELFLFYGVHYWLERCLHQRADLPLALVEGIYMEAYQRVVTTLTEKMGEGLRAFTVKELCEAVDTMLGSTLKVYSEKDIQQFIKHVDIPAFLTAAAQSKERLTIRF